MFGIWASLSCHMRLRSSSVRQITKIAMRAIRQRYNFTTHLTLCLSSRPLLRRRGVSYRKDARYEKINYKLKRTIILRNFIAAKKVFLIGDRHILKNWRRWNSIWYCLRARFFTLRCSVHSHRFLHLRLHLKRFSIDFAVRFSLNLPRQFLLYI